MRREATKEELEKFIEVCRKLLDKLEKENPEKFLSGLCIIAYKDGFIECVPLGYGNNLVAMCLEFFYNANILPEDMLMRWKEDVLSFLEKAQEVNVH
ncbi:MAG: hypothetical protein LWW95_08130 [Candidatus Desulfofervidus auxilii]|nr:hypothetical protein [Candidatus Desulfofervidus auxilii]